MSELSPGRLAPWAAAAIRALRPLLRVAYRPRITGLDGLPEGPFLLVANHSAGVGMAELACFAALYVDRAAERPLAGFAHPIGFRFWPTSRLMPALGCVPSTYEDAARTLEAGVPLLVFPGGDHETLRPLWQAYRVDFGGRRGFLRVASEAGVPVVPMGIRGSHLTAPILLRSRALAWVLVLPRLLRVKRWAISALSVGGVAALVASPLSWPLTLLLSWAWLTSPLVFLPWIPWSIGMRVGSSIPASELASDGALERVQAAVQALVDDLGR